MNSISESIYQYGLCPNNKKQRQSAGTIRKYLDNMRSKYPALFDRIFLRGEAIPDSIFMENEDISVLFDELMNDKIIEMIGRNHHIRSKYLIYPMRDCYIITDFHHLSELNRVFPIFHENVFLASKLKVPSKGKVLDIGFGSGILSIISVIRGASEVYATDVNPKTREYAELNKEINNIPSNKIHFLIGNVYDPLPENIKFDLICSNPPFLAIPSHTPYYIHSNGGPTGTDVINSILTGLKDRIATKGCFQMINMSLGNNKGPFIAKLLYDYLSNQDVSIRMELLQNPLGLDDYITNLKRKIPEKYDEKGINSWNASFKMAGFTHFYYLFIEAKWGYPFSIRLEKRTQEASRNRLLFEQQFMFINGIQWIN
jgi:SAM-dependent methyltransferase